MKKTIAFLLACMLLVGLLSACEKDTPSDESSQGETSRTESEPKPEETTAESTSNDTVETAETSEATDNTQAEETTEPPQTEETTVTTEPPKNSVPYRTFLDASVSIYTAPEGGRFVQTIGQDGTFTIVEEAYDSEGNLWGKLKSGAGWVMLASGTENETPISKSPNPVSGNYADPGLLSSGNYYHCIAETSEYTVQLAFFANETLTNVTFALLADHEANYRIDRTLYSLAEWNPGKPLVTDVEFYGDMTTYGISFTDRTGAYRCFAIYISGMDGSLILYEYEP